MVTEDDFQSVLDANPADHITRSVFADWLEERDDPRAAGYRELAVNECRPFSNGIWYNVDCFRGYRFPWRRERNPNRCSRAMLPGEWFKRIAGAKISNISFPSRRDAENAAAIAWAAVLEARHREKT